MKVTFRGLCLRFSAILLSYRNFSGLVVLLMLDLRFSYRFGYFSSSLHHTEPISLVLVCVYGG